MKSTEIGSQAEALAARYLQSQGMKILARNWRNRWCEIDLVAIDRGQAIHIIEVKYRRTSSYGSGFDYITSDKTARLRRAALAWTAQHFPSANYQIDVISIEGDISHPNITYLPYAIGGE